MRRLISVAAVASVLMLAGASVASAQGFTNGTIDLGPVIGFGGLGDASVSVGGRLEVGIADLPNLANGVLSIEGSFDHYSFNSGNACAFDGENCGFGESFHTGWRRRSRYHLHLDNRAI